jgi:hypothetical protein
MRNRANGCLTPGKEAHRTGGMQVQRRQPAAHQLRAGVVGGAVRAPALDLSLANQGTVSLLLAQQVQVGQELRCTVPVTDGLHYV